jgi:hypothetical protein
LLSVKLRAVRSLSPVSLLLAAQALIASCQNGVAPFEGHDAGPPNDAEVSEAPPEGGGRVLDWVRSEVELEPDGRSAPLSFSLGALERPVFALRAYADDAETQRSWCFQLEEVRADQSALWVPEASSADYGDYCTRCEQPVAVGSGYGFFLLPSAAQPPASFHMISLRLALRDCLTLAPVSQDAPRPRALVVESASYSAPPRTQALSLPLAVVEATPHTFTAGARYEQVFDRVRAIWRQAGIELALRGPFVMGRPSAPLTYSAEDRSSLSELTREARELLQNAGVKADAPLLVFTPCLVRDDVLGGGESQPLATTAHIPGGFALQDDADGIFVASERCGGLTPGPRYIESETLAALIAHELGHFLGLFHVREADGREDVLADTSPDLPNLMQAQPSTAATGLAETQIAVARRHILLAVDPAE